MKRLTSQEFSRNYPTLYHMAAADSWGSIRSLGLLSTSKLIEVFEVAQPLAAQLLFEHRPESVAIEHPIHGTAVVRDQKPMSYSGLKRALPDGTSAKDWVALLNSMVFFWPTLKRLERFINARAYRDQRKTILVIDTATLMATMAPQVRLSPLNSGCTTPFPHPRTFDATFLPLGDYPFYDRKSRGLDPVAEVSVLEGIPNVAGLVHFVVELGGGADPKLLHGDPSGHTSLLDTLGLSKFI